jgi:tetratricopeptide (TPR) repeat protein
LSDVFAVQDRISSAVAQNLRGYFGRGGAAAETPITKVNAYETYLAARSIMRTRTEPSLRQALGLARQVIATDPNYAPGHALYAELIWLLSDDPDAYGSIPAAKAAKISEAHARAAIKLAPNQAEGYAALGLATFATRDSAAISALQRAIELDPSRSEVRIWLATLLTKAGRYDEALELSKDAAAIEPLWQMPIYDLAVRLAVDGQFAQARQLAAQYRARGGSLGQYHRLLFAINSRGPEIASTIAEGQQALKLDPALPNIRGEMMALYYIVGLGEKSPGVASTAYGMAAPALRGDTGALNAVTRSNGANVWNLPDNGFGFFRLAANRDWAALNRLYDQRPTSPEQLCWRNLGAAQAIVPALRAAGRQSDEQKLKACLRNRLAIEAKQKSRSWYSHVGDFEFDQATLAALDGNETQALSWLKQAVGRGWLGIPYSPLLTDRPQFDGLRSDPQLAALQRRIDQRIGQERAEVLARHL